MLPVDGLMTESKPVAARRVVNGVVNKSGRPARPTRWLAGGICLQLGLQLAFKGLRNIFRSRLDHLSWAKLSSTTFDENQAICYHIVAFGSIVNI